MGPKKPNNSNDGSLQPYDPGNGEYKEYGDNIYNYCAQQMGGDKEKFPLGFPAKNYPIAYLHHYFNNEINWMNPTLDDAKIGFLLDERSPKQRFLIFRNLLGYNEHNWQELKNQIVDNAHKYKVFVDKGNDEWGFRAKIYMPIKFANSSKQLIVKTCWLIAKGQKPKFITAWYDSNFERNLKDEI